MLWTKLRKCLIEISHFLSPSWNLLLQKWMQNASKRHDIRRRLWFFCRFGLGCVMWFLCRTCKKVSLLTNITETDRAKYFLRLQFRQIVQSSFCTQKLHNLSQRLKKAASKLSVFGCNNLNPWNPVQTAFLWVFRGLEASLLWKVKRCRPTRCRWSPSDRKWNTWLLFCFRRSAGKQHWSHYHVEVFQRCVL